MADFNRDAVIEAMRRSSCSRVCSYATPGVIGQGCNGQCARELFDFDAEVIVDYRAALAAAEPMIRSDEREKCAAVAERYGDILGPSGRYMPDAVVGTSSHARRVKREIAAAIRAKETASTDRPAKHVTQIRKLSRP